MGQAVIFVNCKNQKLVTTHKVFWKFYVNDFYMFLSQ